MPPNELTQEQERSIADLLKWVISESRLFPKSDPQLVKIPLRTLESGDISLPEAKNLIRYLNGAIGTDGAYFQILNGTLVKDGNTLGTMATEVFEPLENVDMEDDEQSLILWVRNLSELEHRANSLLSLDITKSGLASSYENGCIVIGHKKLGITDNTNERAFCDFVFSFPPKTAIGWADISDKVKEIDSIDRFGKAKAKKDVENILTRLNRYLRGIGINGQLFSQHKGTVMRNY